MWMNWNFRYPKAGNMSIQQPIIACNLSAIDDENLEEHYNNGQAVFDAISEIREISDGYTFKLPAETELIRKTGAFMARERQCCPFFEFSLIIPADHKPVWLKLNGREGVKPYIKETLLPKLDAPITGQTKS